ncbi:epsin [Starmerella bacillaris]|uniref:Epsin n=1 Tax=Starmerella bacillaris TaxID=1247836 RepID=A0AAV5RC97_STABA|nr:epsin [Starmerella bacillaris]
MGIVRQIKNVANGYTSNQVKVRDITANTEETPSLQLMQEVADASFDETECLLIMDMIDKRLNDKGKYWRHVLKALVLLDYLVHYGGEGAVLWCRENLYLIKTLREFHHRDDNDRDVGGAIRARARDLTELITNSQRLEAERVGRGRRPQRYRQPPQRDEYWQRDRERSQSRPRSRRNAEDDDLQRAIELSKQTAAKEEEMRQMSGRVPQEEDISSAMRLTQQNEADMYPAVNYTGIDPYQQQQMEAQRLYEQQLQMQLAAQLQAQVTANTMAQDQLRQQQLLQQQEQLALAQAQVQAEAQAQAQAQYAMQLQQTQQAQQAEQAQQLQQLQQLQQQQTQQHQVAEPLQPFKTGSNNPFAAFAQQSQQAQQAQQAQQQVFTQESISTPISATSTGARRLHRQSTFDKDHMDRLDQILSLDAPMDSFGNTGSAMIPAQHTAGTFVDSSGRGLTAMLTARKTGQANNPFSSGTGTQYTGMAASQMQPAHTGYGFGNANSVYSNGSRSSSANLIDL